MTAPKDSLRATFDVLVLGAGPAGLAASAAAGEAGASVALLDGAMHCGGQYWRGSSAERRKGLSRSWATFVRLQERLRRAGVVQLQGHQVHAVSPSDREWVARCLVGCGSSVDMSVSMVRGRRLVIATGAYDRQVPFPGWDLPGVMTAGGVQALLKGSGVMAGTRIVVAGTGPFLLPVATGLITGGAHVEAVVEASPPATAARHLWRLAAVPSKAAEAIQYGMRLAVSRTRYLTGWAVADVLGEDRVEAVEIVRHDRLGRPVEGSRTQLECDTLAVGWGFTPQLELPLQLGCASTIGADGSLVVLVDEDQRTSVGTVWAAGESTGIGGADLALVEGDIAGRAAAGAVVPLRLRHRRKKLQRFAAAIHAVYGLPQFMVDELRDEVLVCRCEEIDAGAVRRAVRDWGATDARTVKMMARPGMGWCQGRMCGFSIALLVSRECAREPTLADLLALAERPFSSPIPIGRIAEVWS